MRIHIALLGFISLIYVEKGWASEVSPDPKKQISALPTNQSIYTRRYDEIIKEEHERKNYKFFVEREIAGGIAFIVGTYGYFSEGNSPLIRFIYAITQSAGITIASSAYHDMHSPSMLLLIDRYLRKREEMDDSRFERLIVLLDEKKTQSSYRTYAYTSSVLCLLNGYNGYRERKNSPILSNVFLFLSFNFALIAGANYYKMATTGDFRKTKENGTDDSIELSFNPLPVVTYRF